MCLDQLITQPNIYTIDYLHDGTLAMVCPYDSTESGGPMENPMPGDLTFRMVVEANSMTHPTMHENFPNGILNGATWYNHKCTIDYWTITFIMLKGFTLQGLGVHCWEFVLVDNKDHLYWNLSANHPNDMVMQKMK